MKYFFIIFCAAIFIVFLIFLPLFISDWKYNRREKKARAEKSEALKSSDASVELSSECSLKHIIKYHDLDNSFSLLHFQVFSKDVLLEVLKCETIKDVEKIKSVLCEPLYASMKENPERLFFDSCMTVIDSGVKGWYQDNGFDVIVSEYIVRILGESTRKKYELKMERPSGIKKPNGVYEYPEKEWKVMNVQEIVD